MTGLYSIVYHRLFLLHDSVSENNVMITSVAKTAAAKLQYITVRIHFILVHEYIIHFVYEYKRRVVCKNSYEPAEPVLTIPRI